MAAKYLRIAADNLHCRELFVGYVRRAIIEAEVDLHELLSGEPHPHETR